MLPSRLYVFRAHQGAAARESARRGERGDHALNRAASARAQVELKGEDGEFANPEVSSRKSLMLKIGEMIPKLKIRQQRIAHEKAQRQAIEAQQQAKAASAGTNAKKSGKKKGKR